jgi:hypothetical protein
VFKEGQAGRLMLQKLLAFPLGTSAHAFGSEIVR